MKPVLCVREWIVEHGIVLSFYLYALGLAPRLAEMLKGGLSSPEPQWLPGIILLGVVLLEPVGLHWKLRFLRRRNQENGFEPQGSMAGIFYTAAIGHMILTLFLGMMALDAWGAVGEGADDASPWWGAVIVLLILKEFGELLLSAGSGLAREAPGHWKEHLADLLLLAYGCTAYTAWWGVLIELDALVWTSWLEQVFLMPVFAGLFLFFYLPMRLVFLLDEHYLRSVRGRKARVGVELALGVFLGFYPTLGFQVR